MNYANGSSSDATTACSVESQPAPISVLICLVLGLGLLLNIFSMWVFKYRTPEWKSGTVLQFHLAVSDLMLCPLAPFLTVYFALGQWPFGSLMCRLKIILLVTHFYGSIFFLTLISIHRYISVVYHSQEFRMKQKDFVKKLCVGVWAVVLIKGVVCSLVLDTSTEGNRTLCLSIHQETYIEVYFFTNFTLLLPGFLIPFTISLVCYSRLVRSMSGINICHQKGKLMKSKSLKMVAVCLLIFGLCFTPVNVIRTIIVVVKKFYPTHRCLLLQIETSYYVSWILSSANCCLDPLIYCFASQNFKTAFRSSLRKIGVRFQTAREDIEHDSALTTHVNPTLRTIQKGNMSITPL
ncbi:lysophosphatidic acid receptor 6 [Pangasianodon hypophthalmus]|uniref:lysophosphatidic acid receptor 6 n=1 Tax=Pangasianodon hypophthalmus TaxID=310915 RepID=UPI0023076E43|nr:lysophosphatidic acid receptor 6 [Pangasianodon hypophthalmus]